MSQVQLAESLGFGQSFISGVERGSKDVSGELMTKLLLKHQINLNWLLTGEGSPNSNLGSNLPGRANVPPGAHLEGSSHLRIVHPDELAGSDFLVPLLDQAVSAGAGAELDETDQARALIPAPPYLSRFGRNIAALPVRGDSMEPTLRNGDLVVCDTLGWQDEGIYVVQLNAQSFVKRLTIRLKNFIILSDNRAYPPVEEPLESQGLRIVGKVRCALRAME